MPRIRTIKPEFPQSQSVGRLSRDARLLFIQLWTLCDDEGRTRAASRMLASLLYPYDDDAPSLIEAWLAELEREQCIRRYSADGTEYLECVNWLKHQKIDKPSKSRFPPFENPREPSPNPREASCEDQGSRIKERIKDSVPSERRETRAEPPAAGGLIDLERELWRRGVALLVANGTPEHQARGLIGRWLKAIGPPDPKTAVLRILASAEANAVGDLIPYIERSIQNARAATGKQSPAERKADRRRQILEGVGLELPAGGAGNGRDPAPAAGRDPPGRGIAGALAGPARGDPNRAH